MLFFFSWDTSTIHSMLTTNLYKELLDVSDSSEKPHTQIFVLLLMSYIHDMTRRCSYMLITAMTRGLKCKKRRLYQVNPLPSVYHRLSKFLHRMFNSHNLPTLNMNVLNLWCLNPRKPTNSCFLPILMNCTFLPGFTNETPNNYLRNVLLLLKQQELYLLTSTVSTGR